MDVSTPSSAPSSAPTSASTPSASPSPSSSSPSSSPDRIPASAGESQSQPQTPAEGQQTSGETPEQQAVRKFKVTIDGVDSEVDEAELLKGYQRARAANQRFEEAAKIRRQADQLIAALQQDPISLLTNPKLGINFDEIAEKHLLRKLENEMLTPEQRQAREMQEKLSQYEQQEAKRQEELQAQQFEAAKHQARADYERRFVEVLDKANIPKTAETVSRMARYLQESLRRGYEPDLYDVADMVREDMLAEQRALLAAVPDDRLDSVLGEESLEKVRKALLAKVQGGVTGVNQPPVAKPQQQERVPKHMDEFEWRQYIRQKAGL